MHRFAGLAVAGAALALLIPRQAESFTYGRLVAGQVKTDLAYGTGSSWCLVDNGNTEFQMNQSNTKAVISLAEVIYFDGSTYYSLDGQMILTFSSGTGGTIPLQANTNLSQSGAQPSLYKFRPDL